MRGTAGTTSRETGRQRGRFGVTYMDRCSSDARPADLISSQMASATAREMLVAADIGRRRVGDDCCWLTASGVGLWWLRRARELFDVLTQREWRRNPATGPGLRSEADKWVPAPLAFSPIFFVRRAVLN